jgi:hypothetical protein
MLGVSFKRVERQADASRLWRMATLPINGALPLMVSIASDQPSGATLGGKMFQVPPNDVDSTMIEDTLCELVNITAGRLKSMMSLDQALGLPKIIRTDVTLCDASDDSARQVLLKGGEVEILFQVTTNKV